MDRRSLIGWLAWLLPTSAYAQFSGDGNGFRLGNKGSGGGSGSSNAPPVNTVLPVISGTTTVGSVLSTTDGTWTGFPQPAYTYQWNRGGVSIGGATASTYTLTVTDLATMTTVTVTATNASGTASATSAAVGPITSPATAWTPADISANVACWLKADTIAGSTGSSITTWTDASGNSRDATAGTAPTLQVAHQNGLNTINFVAGQYFDLSNTFGSLTQGSVAFVAKLKTDPGAGSNDGQVIKLSNQSLDLCVYPFTGDSLLYIDFGSNYRHSGIPHPATSMANYHICGFRSSASAWQTMFNGTLLYADGGGGVSFSGGGGPYIGRTNSAFNGTHWLDGYVGEIVILNSFLSQDNWYKLEGYLAHKWGLTSELPSYHPYKSTPPTTAPAPTTAQATAFLARTSGLDTTHTDAYKALIDGLVYDNVWPNFDVLRIYATQDSTTALLNLISSSYNGTLNGSPTFTADRGFTGIDLSTTIYINSNFNPSTASSPKYTQNSMHLSQWTINNTACNPPLGYANSGNTIVSYLFKFSGDNNIYLRPQSSGTSGGSIGVFNINDHWIANRSDNTHGQGYRNGVAQYNSTLFAAGAILNLNIYELAINANGTATGSGNQYAMTSIGSSLSITLANYAYTRLRTYMTTVGVP